MARFWFRVALCAPLASGPLIPAPALQVARGIAGAIFTCPVPSHSGKCPLFRMALHVVHRCYSSSLCPFGSVPRPYPPLSAPASQVAGSFAPATPRLAKALACSVTLLDPHDSSLLFSIHGHIRPKSALLFSMFLLQHPCR